MDRLDRGWTQSCLWRTEWELAGIQGAQEQETEAPGLALDVVTGTDPSPSLAAWQMEKAVSWDSDGRGGESPGLVEGC